MSNFILSLSGIIILVSVVSLIGSFFDIQAIYYLPFTGWLVTLLIFNMFLESDASNYFMKNIKNH